MKSLRIMKNSGMDTAAERVGKYLAGNAMGVGNNVLQEVLQEGATMGGVEAAQQYQTGEHAYSFDEVMNRLGDTAASSALTFGTMSLPGAVRNITHIAGGPRTAGGSSVTLTAGADSGVSMMPGVTVDNFPASPLEAGKYRANRPRNVEYPTVPIIHLSMDDVARLNGGKLPEKGGFLRKTAIEHARRRLGLDRHSAVFIPASNVLRNGEEYVLKITKASLDKMFSPSDHSDVPVETVAIMENLERIANNGVYFKSEGDRKRRDQILGVDHLMTTVYIDSAPYIVDMRVRVAEAGVGTHSNNVLYYFSPEEITTIEKADGSTPAAGRHASDGGAPPPTGITIPPMGGGVNIREMRSQGGVFQPGRGLGGQARKVELLPVWGARGGMTAAPSGEIGAPKFVPLPIFDGQMGVRSTPALPVWGTQGGTTAAPSGEIGAPNFVPLPIFDGRLGARSTTALPMQGTKGGETVDNPGENGIIVGRDTEGAGETIDKLLKQSQCSFEDFYKYLNKINSNYADTFVKTGKWPSDIQIPKSPDVLYSDGSINWDKAPKGGYVLDSVGNAIKDKLIPEQGKIIDRYGSPEGRYASPVNDNKPYSYTQRALPFVENPSNYHRYKIKGDFTKIQDYVSNCSDAKTKEDIDAYVTTYYNGDYRKLVSYFGEIASIKGWGEGGGIQYELPLKIKWLIRIGLLEEIF